MIRDLVPWSQLTRTGIPPMKVVRRDLVMGEVIIPVGETLDPELLTPDIRRQRLRQFYEMRLLEPVNPPENSRQFYRDRAQGYETPVEPIPPVASRIVANLPAIEVPVAGPGTDMKRRPTKGVK